MGAREDATTAAEQFIAAMAAGDPAAMAALMSARGQAQLVEQTRRQGFDVETAPEAAACHAAFWRMVMVEVSVDTVDVDDDHATVTYHHATYGRDADDWFLLANVDGRWLVDALGQDVDDDDDVMLDT